MPIFRSSSITLSPPTTQFFLSHGSGTYNPPSNVLYIRVKMVGPGAGGSDSTPSIGSAGSAATTFGGVLSAGAGGVGVNSSSGIGGAGGTASVTTGGGVFQVLALTGSAGMGPQNGISAYSSGIMGGQSVWGGVGKNSVSANAAASTNGSGGSSAGSAAGSYGAAGGAGGYVEAIISGSALATIVSMGAAYVVGQGGAGATGGSQHGGNGGDGAIIVEEFYQ